MDYELSGSAFVIGFIILIIGVIFVRFYQWIADNFGAGVVSYDRYRLYAILTCVLGFLVMLNIHTLLLTLLFSGMFS